MLGQRHHAGVRPAWQPPETRAPRLPVGAKHFAAAVEHHPLTSRAAHHGRGRGQRDLLAAADTELKLLRVTEHVHAGPQFGHRRISVQERDRKSTRLNSSHEWISYA